MRHKPKVLIIEDNEFNHRLFHDAFEQAGFDVTIRSHADGSFIDDVGALAPDIISMDLMIGRENVETERDGFQAIEALKADLRTHEIPIIVVTNFSEESRAERAKELGAADYFTESGQSITHIAKRFMEYVKHPKRYAPTHPYFRDEKK